MAPVCQQHYLTGCWQVPEVLNSKWIPHPGGLHHLAEKIPGLHCKWNEEELRGEKDTGNRSRLSHKPQHLHGGIAGTGSRWQQNTGCNPRAGKYGKGTWDKAILFLIGFNYFPREHQAAPLLGGQCGGWWAPKEAKFPLKLLYPNPVHPPVRLNLSSWLKRLGDGISVGRARTCLKPESHPLLPEPMCFSFTGNFSTGEISQTPSSRLFLLSRSESRAFKSCCISVLCRDNRNSNYL